MIISPQHPQTHVSAAWVLLRRHELDSFSCPRRRFYSLLRGAPMMKIWSRLESHPLCVALSCCHHVHPLVDPHYPLVIRRQIAPKSTCRAKALSVVGGVPGVNKCRLEPVQPKFNRCVTHIWRSTYLVKPTSRHSHPDEPAMSYIDTGLAEKYISIRA